MSPELESSHRAEPQATGAPLLSVVIPFYNEAGNVERVCRECLEVLEPEFAGRWELVAVNDGSSDGTVAELRRVKARMPQLRIIHMKRNSGQSAALDAGFRSARGEFIATLDGDGQNDPRDIAPLLRERERRDVDMMCGIRANRRDSALRRISSRIANRVRAALLHDNITDVGCSMRVFRRAGLARFRMFRNAHRFLPALFIMHGLTVAEMPVNHRPRHAGSSKYGFGIHSRLWAGLYDLVGVRWLRKRTLRYRMREEE